MTKDQKLEDIYYPVPSDLSLSGIEKKPLDKNLVKGIIQSTVKGAYKLQDTPSYDYNGNSLKPTAVATQEQMDMVINLVEALEPKDAIEVALASQFAIVYVRGLQKSFDEYSNGDSMIKYFEFGHKVLEAFQKYRNKGAQQISVQYNVNKGQVFNVKNMKKAAKPIEEKEINI
ncbi:MAG: hypothetical protein K1060chlam3_00259 [Candidatus Anoxychlamydiales bacterium]|nr:hypothetical protein [Candidatus Anoxychlamydiales bacterium]